MSVCSCLAGCQHCRSLLIRIGKPRLRALSHFLSASLVVFFAANPIGQPGLFLHDVWATYPVVYAAFCELNKHNNWGRATITCSSLVCVLGFPKGSGGVFLLYVLWGWVPVICSCRVPSIPALCRSLCPKVQNTHPSCSIAAPTP